MTLGHGEYEQGAQKAPKIATLLGQTSEDLRRQILNRMKDENIKKVKDQITDENEERMVAVLD